MAVLFAFLDLKLFSFDSLVQDDFKQRIISQVLYYERLSSLLSMWRIILVFFAFYT